MNFLVKSGLLLVGTALLNTSMAHSGSLPFSFAVKPGASYAIPTKSLYDKVKYNVSCYVVDYYTMRSDYNSVQISTTKEKSVTVDGDRYASSKLINVKTKMRGSDMIINNVAYSDNISVRNLDYKDTLDFQCKATPV